MLHAADMRVPFIVHFLLSLSFFFFFFNDTATTEIYTLSLHDALPISQHGGGIAGHRCGPDWIGADQQLPCLADADFGESRSEEHTSELQSRSELVCRLLLEKKKKRNKDEIYDVKTLDK